MSDETSIVEFSKENLASLQKFDQADVDSVGGGINFLPYLILCGSNSDLCKSGKIPVATYALMIGKGDDKFIDLGKKVDVFLFCSRPKAFWKTADGQVLISYDPKSELFGKIKAEASKKGLNGAFYGPEYLAWLPQCKKFILIHLNSPTNRNQNLNFKAITPGAATLGAEFIDNGTYKWHGISIVQCSMQLEMPDMEEVRSVADVFNNPPAPTVEVATAEQAPQEAPAER